MIVNIEVLTFIVWNVTVPASQSFLSDVYYHETRILLELVWMLKFFLFSLLFIVKNFSSLEKRKPFHSIYTWTVLELLIKLERKYTSQTFKTTEIYSQVCKCFVKPWAKTWEQWYYIVLFLIFMKIALVSILAI